MMISTTGRCGCRVFRWSSSSFSFASSSSSYAKTGILMLNMGGPRNSEEVEAFLTRLFLDRNILTLPFQHKLGPWIAKRRTQEIIDKYKIIGGGSPILDWTLKQGDMMCRMLDERSPETAPHKPYVGFRYARPLTDESLAQMERDGVERAVAFSQYPQYSCTTTGSSMSAIYDYYAQRKRNKINEKLMDWSVIDRWPTHPKLIETFAENIRLVLSTFDESVRDQVVLLFSAHSLPQHVVNRGDAYAIEVGATVNRVVDKLKVRNPYCLVWQSKVGPLPWLKPGTADTIRALVRGGHKNLMLVPIAFVNEHIETLHELDQEYAKEIAEEVGAERIARCPAPNDHPLFVEALVDIVHCHLSRGPKINPQWLFQCPMCRNPDCRKTRTWFAERNGS